MATYVPGAQNSVMSDSDGSSIALTIDELRWLHISAAIDGDGPPVSPAGETASHSSDINTHSVNQHSFFESSAQIQPAYGTVSAPKARLDSRSGINLPTYVLTPPTPVPSPPPSNSTFEAESVSFIESATPDNSFASFISESSSDNADTYSLKSYRPSSFNRPSPTSSKLDLALHPHPYGHRIPPSPTSQRNRHYHVEDSPPNLSMKLPGPSSSLGSSRSYMGTTSMAVPSASSRYNSTTSSPLLSRSLPTSQSAKRPEWIYRHPRPRTSSGRSTFSNTSALPAIATSLPSRPRTRSITSRHRPRPQTGYYSSARPHPRLQPRSTAKPEPTGVGMTAEESMIKAKSTKVAPFWSNILRPRPVRSRQSAPPLKSLSQAVISPPIPHTRTVSMSSVHSASSSTSTTASARTARAPKHDVVVEEHKDASNNNASRSRAESSSSSSSTSSNVTNYTSSTATTDTPLSSVFTLPSFACPSPSMPSMAASRPILHERKHSLPVSSSCPAPSKSILTRSSSTSTKNSAATSFVSRMKSAGSSNASNASGKSVTFVDVPTVHYHHVVSEWYIEEDEEELEQQDPPGADRGKQDVDFVEENPPHEEPRPNGSIPDMGVDMDEMDLEVESGSDITFETQTDEGSHETSFESSFLSLGVGKKSKGKKKSHEKKDSIGSISSLKKLVVNFARGPISSASSNSKTTPLRPTISGPFALGTLPSAISHASHSPSSVSGTPVSANSSNFSPYSYVSDMASTRAQTSRSTPSLKSSSSIRSSRSAAHPTRQMHHVKAHSYAGSTSTTRSRAYQHRPIPPPVPSAFSYPAPGANSGIASLNVPGPEIVASLHTAPSMESFRSSAAKSVRSLGSVKSTASTRGFRAWLSKIGSGMSMGIIGASS